MNLEIRNRGKRARDTRCELRMSNPDKSGNREWWSVVWDARCRCLVKIDLMGCHFEESQCADITGYSMTSIVVSGRWSNRITKKIAADFGIAAAYQKGFREWIITNWPQRAGQNAEEYFSFIDSQFLWHCFTWNNTHLNTRLFITQFSGTHQFWCLLYNKHNCSVFLKCAKI